MQHPYTVQVIHPFNDLYYYLASLLLCDLTLCSDER